MAVILLVLLNAVTAFVTKLAGSGAKDHMMKTGARDAIVLIHMPVVMNAFSSAPGTLITSKYV